ncbi:MAG: phosphoenolpyruvate--protein phosphotransferase [Candidatus Dormiibacterota bacterium]
MADEPKPAGLIAEPRVGLVLVSHSRVLAEGVAELAQAMAGDEVLVVAAGGMEPPETALGTDATRVARAIEAAWSERGVLVLMDLGSALLSAEMALEFLPEERRGRVRLTSAPLVEGAAAAAVAARIGAGLEQVQAEAEGALAAKSLQLSGPQSMPAPTPETVLPPGSLELVVPVDLPLGLHARPAARVVQASAGLDAEVLASNASTGAGPVSANSFNALARLQIRSGEQLRLLASGPDAAKAIEAVRVLAERRFDEPVDSSAAATQVPPAPTPTRRRSKRSGELTGLAASRGTAVGPVQTLGEARFLIPTEPSPNPGADLESLDLARAATRAELEALRDSTRAKAGAYEAAIVDALLTFLDDPELLDPARLAITEAKQNAAQAWSQTVNEVRRDWEGMADARTRVRAADLEGVSRRVLGHLLGAGSASVTGRGILIARELTPVDTAGLDRELVQGIATAEGGATSHTAILARALGIPAVVGLGPRLLELAVGTPVLLDGDLGTLVVAPGPDLVRAAKRRTEVAAKAASRAQAACQRPAVTRDGVQIDVVANIGSVEEAHAAGAAGADGVGLLRTEFLFLRAASMPDVEVQADSYRAIATALEGRPLTIRTLDVGADKRLPYLEQAVEENPALGVRGLRLGLSRPELLSIQVQAAIRVAREHAIRIMFPMVATAAELTAARRAVVVALAAEGETDQPRALKVGIMVEVPAAALATAVLAEEADFFSIGTNDLSQYTLAADRTNAQVSALADAFHPAVLRLIAAAIDGAETRRRPVAVCGELAGQQGAAALLVGLGIRELSVAVPLVAEVKEAVRQIDVADARQLAQRALALPDADAVRSLISPRAAG